MRVLVVDQDSTMLEAISRGLSQHFTIDAVTTKADCLDLMRQNDFEVIVACERLADGSGLELLSQLAKRWPGTLRIFAAELQRLKLLKGRLGPFELFQTVSYPIDPRQLLSVLTLAGADQNTDAGTMNIQVVPGSDEGPKRPAPAPAPLIAKSRGRDTGSVPAPGGPAPRASASPRRVPASPGTRVQPRSPGQARTSAPTRAPAQPPRATQTRTPAAATSTARQAARNVGPLSDKPAVKRTGFMVGVGIAVMLGAVGLAVKLFNKDDSAMQGSAVPAMQVEHYPRQVTELVADVEAAFGKDDFKHARAAVQKLREIAPSHPRLQFFETLLNRDSSRSQTIPVSQRSAGLMRPQAPTRAQTRARHQTSTAPKASAVSKTSAARETTRQPTTPAPQAQPDPALVPGTASGFPSTDSAVSSGSAVAAIDWSSATGPDARSFSGRTLEDSSAGGTATPVAPPSTAGPPARDSETPRSVTEARLVRQFPPDYPADAARKGVEGAVVVSFTVTREGAVEDVAVVSSEPSETFDRAAIAAVRRWKYEPRIVDEAPVESRAQIRVQFKLGQQTR